jgi:hypothetical protein
MRLSIRLARLRRAPALRLPAGVSAWRALRRRAPALALAISMRLFVSCTEPPPRCNPDPALREAIETELRRELRPSIEAELRRDLRAAVAAEVRTEAGRPGSPPDRTPPEAPSVELVSPSPSREPGTRLSRLEGPLRVHELSVGTAIVDRAPSDVRDSYPEVPEVLFCYTSIESRVPDLTLTHVWRRDGVLVSRVELEVPRSPRWKTWSRQRVLKKWTGTWSCEALSPEGSQLGVTTFIVGPEPLAPR